VVCFLSKKQKTVGNDWLDVTTDEIQQKQQKEK
jgi:hypothetical protein